MLKYRHIFKLTLAISYTFKLLYFKDLILMAFNGLNGLSTR